MTAPWSARYSNTLHGFEHGSGVCVVALTPTNLNKAECVRRLAATGVVVSFDDRLGHEYFTVPEADRAKIPLVLDALLDMMAVDQVSPPPVSDYLGTFRGGFDVVRGDPRDVVVSPEGHISGDRPYETWVVLQTRLLPRYVGGETFSLRQSELAALAAINDMHSIMNSIKDDQGRPRRPRAEDPMLHWWHAREELWCTPEGKTLAREMGTLRAWRGGGPSEFAADGWYTRAMCEAGVADDRVIDYPLCGLEPPAPLAHIPPAPPP
jgi:hypothetical protein